MTTPVSPSILHGRIRLPASLQYSKAIQHKQASSNSARQKQHSKRQAASTQSLQQFPGQVLHYRILPEEIGFSRAEPLGRGGAEVPHQIRFVGKGEAVNEDVHLAPLMVQLLEHSLHLVWILHVHGQKEAGLEGDRQFPHLGLKSPLLVGKIGDAQFGTGTVELLGNAPGDGAVVGDAGDQGLLAAEIKEHDSKGACVSILP